MRGKRLTSVMRGTSPCADCTERHTACHDKCPKDERGEFGYKAWKAVAEKVKETKKDYVTERHQVYEEEKRRKSWLGKTF